MIHLHHFEELQPNLSMQRRDLNLQDYITDLFQYYLNFFLNMTNNHTHKVYFTHNVMQIITWIIIPDRCGSFDLKRLIFDWLGREKRALPLHNLQIVLLRCNVYLTFQDNFWYHCISSKFIKGLYCLTFFFIKWSKIILNAIYRTFQPPLSTPPKLSGSENISLIIPCLIFYFTVNVPVVIRWRRPIIRVFEFERLNISFSLVKVWKSYSRSSSDDAQNKTIAIF